MLVPQNPTKSLKTQIMHFRIWVYQNQKDQQKRGPNPISRLQANARNLKARFSLTATRILVKRKKLMEIPWLISYSLPIPARDKVM